MKTKFIFILSLTILFFLIGVSLWKDGEQEGLITSWLNKGEKESEILRQNGIENGKRKELDRNGSPKVANESISNFDVEGLMRDDERLSIEHKRSFCRQYSLRIINASNNDFMNKILSETPSIDEVPIYGHVVEYEDPYAFILSKNNNPLIIFKGVYIDLKCEDITSDGNPELFADINYAGGNASVIQYIFSMNDFHQLLNTEESEVTWHDGGLHNRMEDLDKDGIKEYNGWRDYFDLIGVCSTCTRPPRKIMCFDGQSYVDCTKRFPELLKEDLKESRETLRSRPEYFKENVDLFHTELIFMIATSINLNQEKESLHYIKTNFSKDTLDWAIEITDEILKELSLQKV